VGDLTGKSVLITGGARRLGKAIALAMASAGADVAITYLESKKEAQQTAQRIGRAGVTAVAIPCDVTEEGSIREAIAQAAERFGGLDILVNNAANYEVADFESITVAQWDHIFATNTRAPYLVTRAALPILRRARGRVINMGSLGGELAWVTNAHYCASKAALHHLSRVMAKALAPEIAVNTVAPGMIQLDEPPKHTARRGRPDTFFARQAQRTPMQRNGTAADVVAAVMFFATAPHFVTGQLLIVDGGLKLA
jgi:NAD(P)-dependent dehydrogenase (short-subunit alcohol dehydrogenase family)